MPIKYQLKAEMQNRLKRETLSAFSSMSCCFFCLNSYMGLYPLMAATGTNSVAASRLRLGVNRGEMSRLRIRNCRVKIGATVKRVDSYWESFSSKIPTLVLYR